MNKDKNHIIIICKFILFAVVLLSDSTTLHAASTRRRGPPPPTSAQTKAFLDLSRQLDTVAVNLQKLQHSDGPNDLPSVQKHEELTEEEKRSMATEVKTILEDVESKTGSQNLHSNHIKMLKDKIDYYKNKLSALNIPTNSNVSKSKNKKQKN